MKCSGAIRVRANRQFIVQGNVMWIVKLALRRPYTFVVLAVLAMRMLASGYKLRH